MNLPTANSVGSADPILPPPLITIEVLLPDGSCIPATPDTLKIVLKQVRSEALRKRKAAAREKADELQRNLEDRVVARRLLQELAEVDRDRRRIAATLRACRVKDDDPPRRTSDVRKRAASAVRSTVTPMRASSWVIDDLGMRGVHYAQSYLGRNSLQFYRGAARDRWEYDARDEAVLRDKEGEPIAFSNLGEDIDEIGAGWQCIEDATTRKNGKIQIRIIVACDADASDAENVAAVRHFCETILAPLGLPYSAVIHRPPAGGDERNVHAHVLTSLRPVERVAPYCWAFADDVRSELDGKNGVQMLRHLWAHSMSEAAEKAGRNMRYTGLGYGARGLDLEPGEHLGEARSAMVARGAQVWAWERNRIRNARNSLRRAIRDADRKIAALTAARDAAIAHLQTGRSIKSVRRLVAAPQPVPAPTLVPASEESIRRSMLELPVGGSKRVALWAASPNRTMRPHLMPTYTPVATKQDRQVASSPAQRLDPLAVSAPKAVAHPIVPACQKGGVVLAGTIERLITSPSVGTATASRQPLRTSSAASVALTLPRLSKGILPSIPLPPSRLDDDALELTPARIVSAVSPCKPALTVSTSTATPNPMIARMDELLHKLARERSRRDAREAQQPVARVKNDVGTTLSEAMQPFRAPQAGVRPHRSDAADARHDQPERDLPDIVRAARWRRARVAGFDDNRSGGGGLDSLPTRFWFESNPGTPHAAQQAASATDIARLDRLTRIDAYVADLGEDGFDIDPRALKAAGADAAWLAGPAGQAGLARIREHQQRLMTQLATEASRRPLDFAKHGTRFWPRDLQPEDLRRLDAWAADPGFQNDVFGTERIVRAAYDHHDAERRAAAKMIVSTKRPEGPSKLARPVTDGFGGMRDTAPPTFVYKPVRPIPLAFDRSSGAPTKPLLMLLHYCGEHPRKIVFADDGRLTAAERIPKSMDNLIRAWRDQERVQALVVETVRSSRAAGRPIYPSEHAAAIRALTPGVSSRAHPPSRGKGMSR